MGFAVDNVLLPYPSALQHVIEAHGNISRGCEAARRPIVTGADDAIKTVILGVPVYQCATDSR
jgi:hypothetical protein